MSKHTAVIDSYLSEPIGVGDPDVSGPLAVFPLFNGGAAEEFISLLRGRERGLKIGEEERAASVRDLVVQNPGDVPVLLYEGEEVLGAQQNRTFDVTVLVGAEAQMRVPVSCVEAGRWDGSRHREGFAPAPQTAYPELRRAKNRQTRERVAAGMDARAEQGAVWDEIAHKSARMGTHSPTGAMHDVYESRRGRIRELSGPVKRRDGQLGALVAIGGRFVVLDYVGRADVFADLFGPLLQGYALDALDVALDESGAGWPKPSIEDARGFVALVSGTDAVTSESIGLGSDLRFAADGVAGAGLATDRGLVQLAAFPDDGSDPRRDSGTRGRIRRPSGRRR